MTISKHTLIRTIYLYLFSLVGLTLLVIGSVNFVNMGLKVFVFTEALNEQRINYDQPMKPISAIDDLKLAEDGTATVQLTADEAQQLQYWITDYEQWKQRQESYDYVTSQLHQDAAVNLAMILIGLPLYLIHWLIIKKETPKK